MVNQPSLLIIINNAAAKARRAWPTIRSHLIAVNIQFDSYETTGPGDATERSRSALRAGTTTIAIVGGDGTLSEAAEGFFEFSDYSGSLPAPINHSAALAILPAGTGDDFARGLMGRRASLDEWTQILLAHCQGNHPPPKLVDTMSGASENYTHRFLCLNASTMGIGGETAARVSAQRSLMRRFSGEARFAAAAVGALRVWRERRVRVTVDGTLVREGEMNLVAVGNGPYAGGGMMLSPNARANDGKLDVVTASGLTRAAVVRELPRIHRGGHLKNPKVQITQGEKVRVETFSPQDAMLIEADGNVRGRTPVEFRIMPNAIRIVQ